MLSKDFMTYSNVAFFPALLVSGIKKDTEWLTVSFLVQLYSWSQHLCADQGECLTDYFGPEATRADLLNLDLNWAMMAIVFALFGMTKFHPASPDFEPKWTMTIVALMFASVSTVIILTEPNSRWYGLVIGIWIVVFYVKRSSWVEDAPRKFKLGFLFSIVLLFTVYQATVESTKAGNHEDLAEFTHTGWHIVGGGSIVYMVVFVSAFRRGSADAAANSSGFPNDQLTDPLA